jgi:hypothetical protein
MLTHRRFLSPAGRGVIMAVVAMLSLAETPMAVAGDLAPALEGVSATAATSDATDFSAARRRRYYRRSNAAGMAFFGMALGTIGAIAAQQRRNDYYNNYGYGYGYGYGPGYYGGGPYYGRRYYRRY